MTDWSTDVSPETRIPSAGIISPARTTRRSPALTSSAATIVSMPLRTTRAVFGVSLISPSIPFRARSAVKSSSSEPICIISATSPAAKYSLVATDAISAIDTRRSALISCSLIRATAAPVTIGIPHSTIAIQAVSTGISSLPQPPRLRISAMSETTAQNIVSFGSLSNQFLNIIVSLRNFNVSILIRNSV